jgi:hypothetical protein
VFSRAFSDSLHVLVAGWNAIWLAILGAIVTALLGLLSRGLEEFRRHVVENIFIAFGGAIATWVLVFFWILMLLPGKMLTEAKNNLDRAIAEKRQFSIEINALNEKVTDLQRQLTEKPPINPVRAGLADLIAKGIKIRDRAPDNGQAPPDVIADWHKWTAEVDRFLRKDLDVADAVTFKSYEEGITGEPLHFIIRNEIGELEEFVKQLNR